MDWLEHFSGLPGPLLLVLGIIAVAGFTLPKVDPPWGMVAFGLIVVLAVGVGARLYNLDRRREAEEMRRKKAESAQEALRPLLEAWLSEGSDQRDFWTRPMLQLPLNQTVVERLLQVFDGALHEAFQVLREMMPDAEPSKVRANIFLPTSGGARRGDVCDLIIPRDHVAAPNGIQKNMKGDELSIAFRPNQGATGRVFVERRAIGVLAHPAWLKEEDKSKQREMDRWIYVPLHPDADLRQANSLFTEKGKTAFEMTEFQNRRVIEHLAWIVSMPIFLKIKGAFEVIGVFNVDCLEYQVKPEQLRAIYYRVSVFAGVLSGVLSGSPIDRVAIFRVKE